MRGKTHPNNAPPERQKTRTPDSDCTHFIAAIESKPISVPRDVALSFPPSDKGHLRAIKTDQVVPSRPTNVLLLHDAACMACGITLQAGKQLKASRDRKIDQKRRRRRPQRPARSPQTVTSVNRRSKGRNNPNASPSRLHSLGSTPTLDAGAIAGHPRTDSKLATIEAHRKTVKRLPIATRLTPTRSWPRFGVMNRPAHFPS